MSDKYEAWKAENGVKFIKALRARLETVTDDNEVIRDTIEGEADVDGILNALIGSIHESKARVKGLKDYVKELEEAISRQESFTERVETTIFECLVSSGINSWKGLKGSASIVPGGQSVEITNEALVPPQYWKKPDPVLAKADVRKDALAGKVIPGVQLKRGEPTITIRKPAGAKKVKTDEGTEAAVH